MNDAYVSKQIEQIFRFIRKEADEKANEIYVSAEEEFNIEKLQLVEAEKKKIRQEYECKQKQVEVRKKIKDDVHLVASVLDSAKEKYAGKEHVHKPEIIIDNIHLPPAPSHVDPHALSCSGGVVLASRDDKIVFENTLDAGLDVIFRGKLPEIRRLLFAQVAA